MTWIENSACPPQRLEGMVWPPATPHPKEAKLRKPVMANDPLPTWLPSAARWTNVPRVLLALPLVTWNAPVDWMVIVAPSGAEATSGLSMPPKPSPAWESYFDGVAPAVPAPTRMRHSPRIGSASNFRTTRITYPFFPLRTACVGRTILPPHCVLIKASPEMPATGREDEARQFRFHHHGSHG